MHSDLLYTLGSKDLDFTFHK